MKIWEWVVIICIASVLLYFFFTRERLILNLKSEIQHLQLEKIKRDNHIKKQREVIEHQEQFLKRYSEELQKQKAINEPLIEKELDTIYEALKEKSPHVFRDKASVIQKIGVQLREELANKPEIARKNIVVHKVIRWIIILVFLFLILFIGWLIFAGIRSSKTAADRLVMGLGVLGSFLGYLLMINSFGTLSGFIHFISDIGNSVLFLVMEFLFPIIIGCFVAHVLLRHFNATSIHGKKSFTIIVAILFCVFLDLLAGSVFIKHEPDANLAKGALVLGFLLWSFLEYPASGLSGAEEVRVYKDQNREVGDDYRDALKKNEPGENRIDGLINEPALFVDSLVPFVDSGVTIEREQLSRDIDKPEDAQKTPDDKDSAGSEDTAADDNSDGVKTGNPTGDDADAQDSGRKKTADNSGDSAKYEEPARDAKDNDKPEDAQKPPNDKDSAEDKDTAADDNSDGSKTGNPTGDDADAQDRNERKSVDNNSENGVTKNTYML